MVEIEAPSTPECQDSQSGQHREEHSVVHHVQEEHDQGHHELCTINQTMNQTMNRTKILEPSSPLTTTDKHRAALRMLDSNGPLPFLQEGMLQVMIALDEREGV